VSKGTPFGSLSDALASRTPSETDSTRSEALRAFEQTIARLAKRADALDDYWQRFRRSCYQGPIVGSFDREWFSVWNPRAMPGAIAAGCNSARAEETARQGDVLPGNRRELRQRFKLDYQ
jgi:hypothetical protein